MIDLSIVKLFLYSIPVVIITIGLFAIYLHLN